MDEQGTAGQEHRAAPAGGSPVPAAPQEESTFPRSLVVRLFVYLVAGHVLAFFLFLLFELGASRQ